MGQSFVDRLEKEQKSGVDPSKYFGYFGFWLRKLKPIANARRIPETETGHDAEAVTLLLVSVAIAFAALWASNRLVERRPA